MHKQPNFVLYIAIKLFYKRLYYIRLLVFLLFTFLVANIITVGSGLVWSLRQAEMSMQLVRMLFTKSISKRTPN